MAILHFNNRDYKISKYYVQKEENSILVQFIAELLVPDNINTSEIWEALKNMKLSGYLFEVRCSLLDQYCYTEGTLLDSKGNEEDFLPLAYFIMPQDYESVRSFLISQMNIVIGQNKYE